MKLTSNSYHKESSKGKVGEEDGYEKGATAVFLILIIIYKNQFSSTCMFSQSLTTRSPLYKSTMRLHHVLQDFKQTENHKSTLENKIHVLKHQYESNKKKAKNIQSSIMKINEIKDHYRREKEDISYILALEKENHNRKIAREKERRENSKDNVHIIRTMIVQEKQQEYNNIKEKERVNQLRITQNFKRSLHEKRQRSLQIKLQEEQSRLTKTIFLEKKRLKAQRNTENEIVPLELGVSMNERYMAEMRSLQNQMTLKLNQSRQNLSKSKLTLGKVLG